MNAAVAIVSLVFLGFGALLLLFPDFVRKHDVQLVPYIPDEEQYKTALLLYGLTFIFFGFVIAVTGYFGALR